MKKELIAALVLLLLFLGTLINIRVVDDLTGDLLALIETAEGRAQSGDMDAAASLVQRAAAQWQAAAPYTHVFIRHSETDGTTDAFFQLLTQLQSGDDAAAEGAFSLLKARLSGIAEIEHISLGSVL